ncbi:MAG: TetR/AcrR family transcriptional regulator [Pseudomonadota bacterium]
MNIATQLTKGERTRANIVTAAAQLFWLRNFHGVSVDQVAAMAGVNKATVYRYFSDKSDLALAVVKYHGAFATEMFFAANLDRQVPPQVRLASIIRGIYDTHNCMSDEHGDVFGCPMMGLALELGQELPVVRKEAKLIFDAIERNMTLIATDAIERTGSNADPKMIGRTLTQLLHGANASARLASDASLVLDAGRAALSLIGFPETNILQEEPSK